MTDPYIQKMYNEQTQQYENIEFIAVEDFMILEVNAAFDGKIVFRPNLRFFYDIIDEIDDQHFLVQLKNRKLKSKHKSHLNSNGLTFKNLKTPIFDTGCNYIWNPKNELLLKFPDEFSKLDIESILQSITAIDQAHFEKTYLISCEHHRHAVELKKHLNQNFSKILVEFNFHTIKKRIDDDERIGFYDEEIFKDKQQYITPHVSQDTYEAHKILKGNKKIKIAILDDGVYPFHKNILNCFNAVDSYDAFNDNNNQIPYKNDWHGTVCAGIAAASVRYNYGMNGVGAGCSIIGVRMFHKKHTTLFTILKAFYFAGIKARADVLSCSFKLAFKSEILASLLKRIYYTGRNNNIGAAIVLAAGNEGREVCFPNTLPYVITVAGVDQNNNPLKSGNNKSNYGSSVNISATGDRVLSLDLPTLSERYTPYPNPPKLNEFLWFSGTSASAPQVAGCIGLMLSANPNLTPEKLLKILEQKANPFTQNSLLKKYGAGSLNITASVKNALINQ